MMTENFENVNHLVLNFYLDGYSIAVKLNEFPVFTSETILETAKISYEETSLLDYIEHEELPPLLVEMIDSSPKLSQYKIWHNGCLILEVRDKMNVSQDEIRNKANKSSFKNLEFRNRNSYQTNQPDESQVVINHGSTEPNKTTVNNSNNNNSGSSGTNTSSGSSSSSSYFILLKPTNLSILNDVLNLTESNLWSTQDRLQLESQIVLQSSPHLYLEPNANDQPKEHSNNWTDLPNGNIITKHRKKLPHTKLKSIYSSNNRNCIYQATSEILPPELTLQQFLATKKAGKKNFAGGHLARFHRFKKNLPTS